MAAPVMLVGMVMTAVAAVLGGSMGQGVATPAPVWVVQTVTQLEGPVSAPRVEQGLSVRTVWGCLYSCCMWMSVSVL